MDDNCRNDHDLLVAHLAAFKVYQQAMEDRLFKLNELREQVEKDRQTYLLAAVYEAQHSPLVGRVNGLENRFWMMVGVATALVSLAAFLGHYWK